jgi:hypothetical protein
VINPVAVEKLQFGKTAENWGIENVPKKKKVVYRAS